MHFISGIKSGGVEQMLINYTSLMNKKYNTENVIVYQHNPNPVCLQKLVNAGDRCIQIASKKRSPFRNFIDSIRVIKKERPDIIHAHMGFLNFIPLICGLICGVKIRISHSHVSNNIAGISTSEKIIKHLNFLNLAIANKYLACGYGAGICMYGNRKFEIVYNSVDISKFSFNQDNRINIRRELKLNDDDILIGNVGRLTFQKNQVFLIEMMRDLVLYKKNFKLVIIGNGELKDNIIDLIRKYRLESNILVHDPVKNINEYYDAMDIFVLPSLYEGFPVSLVEAQINGLNCIVSNTIDSTSKINSSVTFLSNKDVNLWTNAVLKQKKYDRKIDVNKFMIFDINNSYEKLYKIYNQLMIAKTKRR